MSYFLTECREFWQDSSWHISELNLETTQETYKWSLLHSENHTKWILLGERNEWNETLFRWRIGSRRIDRFWGWFSFVENRSFENDCDNDTLLVQVNPNGPTCHKGDDTCWAGVNEESFGFISKLEQTITNRIENADSQKSYVASLLEKGINKVAQKVGEEAVEVVIEAKDDNEELFLNESADLLFHYLVLLQAKGYKLNDVVNVLKSRQK